MFPVIVTVTAAGLIVTVVSPVTVSYPSFETLYLTVNDVMFPSASLVTFFFVGLSVKSYLPVFSFQYLIVASLTLVLTLTPYALPSYVFTTGSAEAFKFSFQCATNVISFVLSSFANVAYFWFVTFVLP